MGTEPQWMFAFSMDHNLNEIIRFQNFMRGQLNAKFADVCEHPFAAETLNNYDKSLSELCFLSLYAYLEEYLFLVWKKNREKVSRSNENSILRYLPVVRCLHGGSDPTNWPKLVDMMNVRNCLLHANGRISFMNNPGRIREIVRKYSPSLSVVHNDRLIVEVTLLSFFVEQIKELRDGIEPS